MVKLGDFGIAKVLRNTGEVRLACLARLFRTSSMFPCRTKVAVVESRLRLCALTLFVCRACMCARVCCCYSRLRFVPKSSWQKLQSGHHITYLQKSAKTSRTTTRAISGQWVRFPVHWLKHSWPATWRAHAACISLRYAIMMHVRAVLLCSHVVMYLYVHFRLHSL